MDLTSGGHPEMRVFNGDKSSGCKAGHVRATNLRADRARSVASPREWVHFKSQVSVET